MNNNIIAQISETVKQRLESGSPFSSPSAAWQGSEVIAAIDGVTLSLSYTSCDKMIRIRATNRTEFLGSLEIARRVGRGQYEALASQGNIAEWLSEVTGQGESKSLLDLAIAEFTSRTQWSNETITIWESGNVAAWLSRNSQGYITLTLFKDAKKLTARRYSKPLAIGFFSPGDSMWIESPSVREDYKRWSVEARAAVQ